MCPQCESLERHRLFWLWFQGQDGGMAEPILHFAPEAVLERKLRSLYAQYRTADLFGGADLKLNIEEIDLPDGEIKTVICNHVFEHVDDRKALAEICRILADDGCLVASVPIIEGWDTTYEDARITDPGLRELHFGLTDHLRQYGRDFRDRLRAAGFLSVEEFTAGGSDSVEFGLLRGEKIFTCTFDRRRAAS
jgi:SAM-dependent methyltransferase